MYRVHPKNLSKREMFMLHCAFYKLRCFMLPYNAGWGYDLSKARFSWWRLWCE